MEVSGNSIEPLWLGFETWRWMFWIELLPALLFFACLLLIPESPRYLAITNQHTKGMNVLGRLFGKNKASAIWQDIRTSIDNNSAIKITDVLNPNSSKLKAVIWIGIGLAVLQQLAGVNVVFYYGAVLWQAVGFSESDALLINIISGAISIVACFIALMLIDKIGRKPLLLIGSVGMTFSLFGIATAFANGTIGADGQLDLGSWSFTALLQVHLYVFFLIFHGAPSCGLCWGNVSQ
ncbi:MFS transporter [Psychrosphaera algicola]|uniref:MFS transporter n=1 Tax=Psychrosphaera algicola TaxID=3023714 RepID=A0ABT5FFZ0_9GAMM|nr:MFS transporter [Psychrosphaera sp. G1-22]MDC2890246.1 MFS transporter [Psychrosphaera sp. G1-22]